MLSHINGKKVTDAELTENMQKNVYLVRSCLSGGECRPGSRKERIRTEQVTDRERPTKVRVTNV